MRALFILLGLLWGVLASAQESKSRFVLNVSKTSQGDIDRVSWEDGSQSKAAVSSALLSFIRNNPKALVHQEGLSHALVVVPFGDENFPLGDVILLSPQAPADFFKSGSSDPSGLLGQEPIEVKLNRWGFYYTQSNGAKFTVEHYDILKGKSEVLVSLDAAKVGSIHRITLSEDVATVKSEGKAVDYRPNGRRPEANLVYAELAVGNIDTIEGDFGGIELTQKAKDGQLEPDDSEIELAVKLAGNIRRNRQQKSILLWGNPGTDTRGIVHLFAKKVAEAKEEDPNFGWFKDWKIYELNWSKFGAEGLVDIGTDKANRLMTAASQKKVILVFDQVEQLIGLGSNKDSYGDVASALLGALKTGQLILIGTTTSDGIRMVRSRQNFFGQFYEISVAEPKGETLLAKVRLAAERKLISSRVSFSDESLKRIIEVTNRYLSDKGQPEKSLAAIEALAVEHSPLRMAEPDADSESIAPFEVNPTHVNDWIAKAARIATLASDNAEVLSRFIISKEFDSAMDKEMAGQKRAKESVKNALLSIARGIRRTNAQGNEIGIETLLFVGPSGTGKTYLYKVISKILSDKGISLPVEVPIQGSMLTDGPKGTAILTGAAPGYLGYDPSGEGGLLYQMVKRSPQAIIVLEEFDKVHEDIDKFFYEFLDGGTVTNVNGKKAGFNRGLFILTANFGVEGSGGGTSRSREGREPVVSVCNYIDRWDRHHLFPKGDPLHIEDSEVAGWDEEALRVNLFNCLKEHQLVNPQILGRIGKSNLVVFHHLTKTDIEIIRDQQLAKVVKEYEESYGAKLELADELKQWLLDEAWDPDGTLTFNVGARAIEDVVKEKVGTVLLRFTAEQGEAAKGRRWKLSLHSDNNRAVVSFE